MLVPAGAVPEPELELELAQDMLGPGTVQDLSQGHALAHGSTGACVPQERALPLSSAGVSASSAVVAAGLLLELSMLLLLLLLLECLSLLLEEKRLLNVLLLPSCLELLLIMLLLIVLLLRTLKLLQCRRSVGGVAVTEASMDVMTCEW